MILLCMALHIYHGPVDFNTPVTVAFEACRPVHRIEAKQAFDRCAVLDATRCEGLIAPDGHWVIEVKVRDR